MRITFSDVTPGAVYRALRDDAAYPFVTLADGPGYDEAHADGDVDGSGGVLLIETFEARLEPTWHERREHFSTQRGYLGSRLLRGEPGFVAIVRWSSPLMHFRATRGLDSPFTSALYLRA